MSIIERLDGKLFAEMMISAANNLYNNKNLVDELNVFPVPDGDTGTNMSLTARTMAEALKNNPNDSLTKTADTAANATLRGARGNSGVIMSQFFRGISKSLKGRKDCCAAEFAAALKEGADTAYKAVMNPTEGTILTVAREAAQGAVFAARKKTDITEVLRYTVVCGNAALEKTPELLPALKQAGVVDSGGKGWMCILEGALSYLMGNAVKSDMQLVQNTAGIQKMGIKSDIRYGYCTEFIVEKSRPDVDVNMFKRSIEKKGDCMLVIDDEEIVKVHIHTNHPGFVLEKAILLGSMINIKIDNMKHQHNSLIQNETKNDDTAGEKAETVKEVTEEMSPIKEYGFVAVSSGDGFEAIFKDLNVDEIIKGGQTMNPSTDDLLEATERINAKNIFVFPNNKNIIMAANQAKELSEKNIIVIPSKNIPECVTAIMNYDEKRDVDTNEAVMLESIENVKTGQITYAVRDTQASGKEIKAGDVLGITGSDISIVGGNADDVCKALVDTLTDDDSEFITIYYGDAVNAEQANLLADELEEKYDDCEVALRYGGQAVYYYIISVE